MRALLLVATAAWAAPAMAIPVNFDWTVTVGQVITFMTLIAGFIYTWMREGRARKWSKEDADQKSQHMERQDVAIQEGSTAAKEAYNEANTINSKIADLQGQVKNIAQRKSDRRATPDRTRADD